MILHSIFLCMVHLKVEFVSIRMAVYEAQHGLQITSANNDVVFKVYKD